MLFEMASSKVTCIWIYKNLMFFSQAYFLNGFLCDFRGSSSSMIKI